MRFTLNNFIKANNGQLGEPFRQLMAVVEKTAKTINDKLSRNGLIDEQGSSGGTNVYGEDVQKLDHFADSVFTRALFACPAVCAVGSEELAKPEYSDHDGEYIVTHDPLDGSSNIDTNLPIGTIFAVYPKSQTILQKGNSLVASGYILYGPSMMLVYATSNKVNAFTYDFKTNDFILSHEDIRIGDIKIYSINEGNFELFDGKVRNYLSTLKKEGGYSLRYVGSMVADIHRTLLKGGIFIYPTDSKHENGKLRLLYEVAPLSFLIVASGGSAVSNGMNPLDIVPIKHDQRVPIALGNKTEVEKYILATGG